MERPELSDNLFKKSLKLFLYIILPITIVFLLIVNTSLTGNVIDSEKNGVIIITGSFLGTIVLFFILLLVILKIRLKPYKPSKVS